jgi:hypothetical protein
MQIPLTANNGVLHSFSRKISLATIGVCVFYASASVGAFFMQKNRNENKKYKI